MPKTKEIHFEQAIEAHLLEHGGYEKGRDEDFDPALALDPAVLVRFLKATQPQTWQKLADIYGPQVGSRVVKRIADEMDARGLLDVVRNGVKDRGQTIRLAYFRPASGLNPDTLTLYGQNILTVTRQVHFHLEDKSSIDMLLSLNGLPIATVELKNPFTGQSSINAIKQYIKDRKPSNKTPLLQFKKRALVHFAVDPDEVFMATKLAGKDTFFLPFNKGCDGGRGNPVSRNDGHRTAYLWEQVWQRDSWLDIIHRFIALQVEEQADPATGKTRRKETIIFPRYHQLAAVRKLVKDTREGGAGRNYLVQHSAGSGKTNTITWTAHQLASLHGADERPVFDSVVVVSDRRNLDQQLQDNIYQFEHKQGVVEKIDKRSDQLAEALNKGTRIIVTTLQKFSFVLDKVRDLSERCFAVIVDEAHSSQSGRSAANLKVVLGSAGQKTQPSFVTGEQGVPLAAEGQDEWQGVVEEDAEVDTEEVILEAIRARGPQKNLSFYAFTATPKHKTLEMFGTWKEDGKPHPFHLYSMRQAIEEGFIHDVLKHYTTYKTYFKLSKAIEDDPEVDSKKAKRAIARFVHLHPYNLAQKTEVMVEHFREHTRKKIGGRAKAMVVTASRLHAVRYYQEFRKYIEQKGYTDLKPLVAFSGTVEDPDFAGESYTESGLNGFAESELPRRFAGDDYQVLLVAEKYQTGFDQPLLHTMFVDKPLKDLKAVQTLSRLNRTCGGKVDTFVLDFANEVEEIKEAFKPYYEVTEIEQPTDPNLLYTLQNKIGQFHIIWQQQVEDFAAVFFKPKKEQRSTDHGKLNQLVDPAVERFKSEFRVKGSDPAEEKYDERGEEFRHHLNSFIRLYGFVSQMVSWQDAELEKLYVYARHLVAKLPRRSDSGLLDLDDEVTLTAYRNDKTFEGSGSLGAGDGTTVTGITAVGTGKAKDEKKTPLSELIEAFNERFGGDLGPEDQLFFEQLTGDLLQDEKLAEQARQNTIDQFRYAFTGKATSTIVKRHQRNQKLVNQFMQDPEVRELILGALLQDFYNRARETVRSV